MEKDTVIFDLDGTLLNSLEDLHACCNYVLEYFGYPKHTIDEIREFVGNGIKKAFERALPDGVEDKELEKIVEFFRGYYKLNMDKHTKPYDGIIELLENLKNNGYKIGVVSNKHDEEVKILCKYYFKNLVDIAIGEGNGIRRKPEPDGVYKAINELNSNIEKSIYVGDSNVDIMTANNVGIPCISVLWGYRTREFLEKNGGKIFVETAKDIEKILSLS